MKSFIMKTAAVTLSMTGIAFACGVVPQGTCYVKETGQYMPAREFFSAVANLSNRQDSCTVGRVAGKESGRMYYNGQRLRKDLGCLSHREISQVKSEYGLNYECSTYTCEEQ